MPRFDGTGPMGQGPMTGRGAGPCGMGYGRGYGGGFPRGIRRGIRGFFGQRFWPTQPSSPSEEKKNLKDEIRYMEEDLKEAKKYLSELEKGDK